MSATQVLGTTVFFFFFFFFFFFRNYLAQIREEQLQGTPAQPASVSPQVRR